MGITIYVNCIYLLPRLATPLRVSFCSKKLEQTSRGEHFWPGRRLGMGQKSKLFRINIFGLERDGTSQLVQYSKINDPYIYIYKPFGIIIPNLTKLEDIEPIRRPSEKGIYNNQCAYYHDI